MVGDEFSAQESKRLNFEVEFHINGISASGVAEQIDKIADAEDDRITTKQFLKIVAQKLRE